MSARFRVDSLDAAGKRQSLIVEASSPADAAARLRATNVHPLRIELMDGRISTTTGLAPPVAESAITLSPQQQEVLLRQLARMTGAGLRLERALAVIAEGDPSPRARALASDLRQRVRSGAPPAAAFEAHPHLFGSDIVALLRAAEVSGQFAAALGEAERLVAARNAIRSRIISALVYPAILGIVALGSLLTILLLVIPRFRDLVMVQGASLPLAAQIVFALSDLVVAQGWLLALLAGAGLAGLAVAHQRGTLGRLGMAFASMLPGVGTLIASAAEARVLRVLGTLLGRKVGLVAALGLATEGSDDRLSAALAAVRDRVKAGGAFSEAVAQEGAFGPLVVQFARVGEETGDLGAMLLKSAEMIEERLDREIKRFFILLEPSLLVVIGLLTGGLLYGLFSAILTLNQAAQF